MGNVCQSCLEWHVGMNSLLRPGQWLGWFHKLNRAEVKWTFKGIKADEVLKMFTEKITPLPNYAVATGIGTSDVLCAACNGKPAYKAHYLTGDCKWADVIEASFSTDKGPDTVVRVSSASLNVWPAAFPLSFLIGIALSWTIFFDHGANMDHLVEMKRTLNSHLNETRQELIQEEVILPGAKVGKNAFIITVIAFFITVGVTVLNLTVIPKGILNDIITFVTVSLTVLTFCTWWNAYAVWQKDKLKQPDEV